MSKNPDTILIADDDPTIRVVLKKIFEKAGYRVILVEDGQKAVESFSQDIAAVLLDLNMPRLNGIEALRCIREMQPDISPIMLTASDDVANAVEAVKSGAFDYIIKPFHAQQLIALVEKAIVTDRNARRVKRLEAELQRARDREIDTASRIQQTLLMGVPPTHLPGIDISTLTIPSQKVDGDFYDFFLFGDEYLHVVVGDVMGKGIASALLGAATKTHCLRIIHELENLHHLPVGAIEPAIVVSHVRDAMFGQIDAIETFVTLCYGRFDLKRSLFSFVDCGHMRTIHYHAASDSCTLLEGINMPLGFPETEPYTRIDVPFAVGDLFFFYSDGLTEAMDATGRQFGEQALVESVLAHRMLGCYGLIHHVKDDIVRFSGSETFQDDFTAVAVAFSDIHQDRVLIQASLELENEIVHVPLVRKFVQDFCKLDRDNPLADFLIDRLTLAATEVVTNIMRHAYRDQSGGKIQMLARLTQRHIQVEFFDRGAAFNPSQVAAPKFDGTEEGGYGMYIISRCVDRVVYERDRMGVNVTRLILSRDAAPDMGEPSPKDSA
jgi:sigma-B regulation protein RsbU (phosphoserine phosphatase)